MKEPIEQLLRQMSLAEPSERCIATGGSIGKSPPPTWQPGWMTLGTSVFASALVGLFVGFGVAMGLGAAGSEVQPGSHAFAKRVLAPDPALAAQSRSSEKNPVALNDDGLFLLNGTQPVRRYRATTLRQIETIDPQSGQRRFVEVPVYQMIVTPSVGT